jgi:hypothetical protein
MALASFTRINPVVSVHSPTSKTADDTETTPLVGVPLPAITPFDTKHGAPPSTILLLSWGDAAPKHIEKYTALYTSLCPNATIVLVRGGMADFFYRSNATLRRLVTPAVEAVKEPAEEGRLLVHVMSNAGSKQWCTVNEVYGELSGGKTLGTCVTVVDSAPGRSRFWQTWAALSASLPKAFLPRMLLGCVFGMILCTMHLWKVLGVQRDVMEVVRDGMNEAKGMGKEATRRRCYIYSEDDPIIAWEDVEDHAKEAEGKGWEVQRVKIQGGTHVGHLKRDPVKYREAIEKTWFGLW